MSNNNKNNTSLEEFAFFDKKPAAFPFYEAVRCYILSEFADVKMKVQKTQITFSNKHGFAFVSLPQRKVEGNPKAYLLLTLGLNRKLEHPRVYVATEPYPGRWTHHFVIQSENDIDDEIKKWIDEAYHYAKIK